MTTAGTGVGEGKHLARYDEQMRPVEATEADGTRTTWAYQRDGGVVCTVTAPDRRKTTIGTSGRGRKQRVESDGSPAVETEYDEEGG